MPTCTERQVTGISSWASRGPESWVPGSCSALSSGGALSLWCSLLENLPQICKCQKLFCLDFQCRDGFWEWRCFQRHQSNFCKQWKKKHSVLSSGSSHFVLFVEILQIWMYFSHKVYWEHLFRNSSLYSLHWILRPIIFACKIGEIGYFFMVKV